MMRERYNSVWDAIMDTPQESLNMKLRSDLMLQIRQTIEMNGWTQKKAAKELGVTQPRISDLLRGKIDLFSLDMLVNMLASMGEEVEIKIKAT
ncbi:helix-turn-helix domain-containing protein [sulfur-oxidizing endosymbiont of Gigantopelta aegis]|uniref:helix-turn-helix domain-containing protein n=1 Tax=sulfur-oxidizing endosymbiont of Gigantopelta aegis TaxID=2794934 RepID=UPI0018DE78B0|nr:XRE family transcriptional regulator [sulfur-oxidizing endosymbiont of Gigantopelta aegis]